MQPELELTRTGAPISPEALPLPGVGTIIDDRYRIVRPIGAGGMGAVYEAEQTRVGRRCALKFLRTELSGRSRSEMRFRREACILGRLEHEHLTTVLDFGMYLERSPFLVMEYLDGCTLKDRMVKEGRLPVAEALDIIQQVVEGMAYVHARGIVHRDLKPDNLMLLPRGGMPLVKILDFGIARVLEDGGGVTISGTDIGTVAYMSPEQARGAQKVSSGTDVFAIGTILYEMLAGVRPHPGDSYHAVMFHLLTREHASLERVLPGCPPQIAAIVERCLEKDYRRRYESARELLTALSNSWVKGNDSVMTEPSLRGDRRWGSALRAARAFVPGLVVGGLVSVSVGAWTRDRSRASETPAARATAVLPLQSESSGIPQLSIAVGLNAAADTEPMNPIVAERELKATSPKLGQPALAASAEKGYRLRLARTPPISGATSAGSSHSPPLLEAPLASEVSPVVEAASEGGSPFLMINPYGAD